MAGFRKAIPLLFLILVACAPQSTIVKTSVIGPVQKPVIIRLGMVSYNTETEIITIPKTDQHFKILSRTPSSVTVEYLEGGMYYHPGEPPGPTNPFYPCVTTFRSSGFQWEKDAVELVNR